ncbi:MAG: sigma-70 family RNA polymerase sigma factor [Balneolaceae bacterium]
MQIRKGTLVDNKEAWERFVSGEDKYFKEIFSGYYNTMFGYGVKLSDRPELVKDCIQELFRDIWERRADLEHIESSNVYLFVSLRRKILKRLKSQRRIDSNLSEMDESASIHFGMEDIIINDEIRFQQKKKLQEALNQLSNRQKEIVYLHFYNGMSYGEIEQILSINRQSVRNHMCQAMGSLRTLLNPEYMKLLVSY